MAAVGTPATQRGLHCTHPARKRVKEAPLSWVSPGPHPWVPGVGLARRARPQGTGPQRPGTNSLLSGKPPALGLAPGEQWQSFTPARLGFEDLRRLHSCVSPRLAQPLENAPQQPEASGPCTAASRKNAAMALTVRLGTGCRTFCTEPSGKCVTV